MVDIATRAHTLTAEEVADALGVDTARGLPPAEVTRRRAAHGWNELPAEPPEPFWRRMLAQFDDALVKVLLAAAAVSFVLALSEAEQALRAMAEPFVILLILVLNALVGAVQESSAARAIDALKQYEPDDATVLRPLAPARGGGSGGSGSGGGGGGEVMDGVDELDDAELAAPAPSELRTVRARELVPGDVLRLCVGDRVPADCRALAVLSTTLRVEQALLTGETRTSLKDAEPLDAADLDAELQAQRCILFAGTTVAYGSALALVVATGERTQMGRIGAQVAGTRAAPSPLKQRLDELGALLSRLIGAVCVGVWLLNVRHFGEPAFGGVVRGAVYYFKVAVALAVAAIPEGLPAVVTTCLALGTRRMARRNAIARSLPAVETLGSTSVICSDKTVRRAWG